MIIVENEVLIVLFHELLVSWFLVLILSRVESCDLEPITYSWMPIDLLAYWFMIKGNVLSSHSLSAIRSCYMHMHTEYAINTFE